MDPHLAQYPHRRANALTGDWVFVSPHRTKRPWQGKVEAVNSINRPAYDPQCYLCAGNLRAHGERNPAYEHTHAFTNDFAAFGPIVAGTPTAHSELLNAQLQAGTCRVLCFSPRHDLTLADLTPVEIRQVVDLWISETTDLGRHWPWVQVFENKGEIMGCSNPHPHGQIWASNYIPNEPAKESVRQREWYERKSRQLLLDYAMIEMQNGERVVAVNEHWMVVVPWWAVWPFETLLIPLRPWNRLLELPEEARD